MFRRDGPDGLKSMAYLMLPFGKQILDFIGVPGFKNKELMFFYHLLKSTLEARRSSSVKRRDLIDLMLQALKQGAKSKTMVLKWHF